MAMDWSTQKKIMFFFGILVIIVGALPLIVQYNVVPLPLAIPISGWKYQLVVIVLGVLLIFFGKPSKNSY